MAVAETLGTGLLTSLLAQPFVKALDRSVIDRCERVLDDRNLRRTFGAAVAAAIDEARRRDRSAGALFDNEHFLTEQAVIELHKFFTPNERPDPARLTDLCKSYFGSTPPNMREVAACFIDALEKVLLDDRDFADLIRGRQIGETHEAVRGIGRQLDDTYEAVRGIDRKLDGLKAARLERARYGIDLTDQLGNSSVDIPIGSPSLPRILRLSGLPLRSPARAAALRPV